MNKLRTTELYASKNLQGLEKKLDHTFKDQSLLIQSVTRKGHVKELKDKNPVCERLDNERLEFLGDSVLELIMRKHLYKTMPDGEDVLTPTCSEIVKRRSLAKVAFDFGLDEHLFLASSEKDNLRRKPRILADSLEAVIGAVFLETDYCRTTDIVLNRIFQKQVDTRGERNMGVERRPGFYIIDNLVKSHVKNGYIQMPDFMKSLVAPSLGEYSATKIREYHNNDCNLHYTAGRSHEILMWGLGLMCFEYSLEMFKDKMIKGHCNAHGEPCEAGGAFHNQILYDCISSYQSIIDSENDQLSLK